MCFDSFDQWSVVGVGSMVIHQFSNVSCNGATVVGIGT